MLGAILVLAVLALFLVGLGMFCGWLVLAYLNRKIAHEELELQIAKIMSELIAEMRKEGEFSDKQKTYLHGVLYLSESKVFARFYLFMTLFGSANEKKESSKQTIRAEKTIKAAKAVENLEAISGFSKDSEIFSSVVALMMLSFLKSSTHNFFLGRLCRRRLFARVSENPKLAKNRASQKDFFGKSGVYKFVKRMPEKVPLAA